MMARKAKKGLSEKHKKVLDVLGKFSDEYGYPPSIREICTQANISSTSVANYYLDRLEKLGYIERDRRVSRGLRLVKSLADIGEGVEETVQSVKASIEDLLHIPIVGQIVASQPVPVPETSFSYVHPDSMIDVARNLLPNRNAEQLFALEVSGDSIGDSMIDAMVNDGDIVIMQPPQDQVKNGDMVAVWLNDKDETTLKYFYHENGGVRLQPANPTMGPIFIDDASTVEIQGKVVMVVRQMENQ
jgi:repressor LexA